MIDTLILIWPVVLIEVCIAGLLIWDVLDDKSYRQAHN
jgi:predicted RNA-binding protein